MDGSVVIGVELEDEGFYASLQRLRQTAGQTAAQALGLLAGRIEAVNGALAAGAQAGSAWLGRLETLAAGLAGGIGALGPSLMQAGTQAGNMLLAGLLAADVSGVGGQMAAGAIGGFRTGAFAGAGASAAGEIQAGLLSGLAGVISAAAVLAAGVKSRFAGGWQDVGYQISAGIAAGVTAGSGLISAAAISAARNALAAAKQALGVRSPSRVFREQVGRMIPAGMALGIRDAENAPAAAIAGQAQRLTEAARQQVIPAAERSAGRQREWSPGANLGLRIHLEAPVTLDGRELGRAAAEYTGRQLEWEAMG